MRVAAGGPLAGRTFKDFKSTVASDMTVYLVDKIYGAPEPALLVDHADDRGVLDPPEGEFVSVSAGEHRTLGPIRYAG